MRILIIYSKIYELKVSSVLFLMVTSPNGGAHGIMVFILGNKFGDSSSNSRQNCFTMYESNCSLLAMNKE